ncbi:MAG: PAS domain S-box protein [Myxococcota bacterium]
MYGKGIQTGKPPEHAFAEFVRALPMPVAFLDREMCYVAYSEAWIASYRLEDDDLVGRCHYDVFPQIDERWKSVHRRCLAGETLSSELDSLAYADGRTEYLRWSVTPWRSEDGAIGGIVLYTQVITDFVQTAMRLAEREDFIRILFERSPIGLNLSHMDGRWIQSNPAFLEMIGYSAEEASTGLTYWDLTPSRYHADEQKQLESLEATGRYGPYEKEFIRKDGALLPVKLSGFLMEREGERYIWSLIEDTSERKRLEQSVEEERMKAIQASKLATLGEMAAGIAHEINNPLAIIDGYAGLLPDLVGAGDSARLDESVRAIADATRRATQIVYGLRKFARVSDSESTAEVPIEAAIEQALDLCGERIRKEGAELRLAATLEGCVSCNETELTQVLVNLLNNALHAVGTASEKWIAVEARVLGEVVEICVRDSGHGVDPEHRETIFEPFFTTKKPGQGTGLGLSISRGIVERFGGSLELDPDSQETCFRLRLPALPEPR